MFPRSILYEAVEFAVGGLWSGLLFFMFLSLLRIYLGVILLKILSVSHLTTGSKFIRVTRPRRSREKQRQRHKSRCVELFVENNMLDENSPGRGFN